MFALKPLASKAPAIADLLPWATLMADGVIITKDGALLTGWLFRGPDIASMTPAEQNHLASRMNAALAPLGDGWAMWFEAVRMPAASYPPKEAYHFPDAISAAINEERRQQFLAEGAHFETQQAFFLQYTPPLRHKSWLAEQMYHDALGDGPLSDRQLEAFHRACLVIEDTIGEVLQMRRMTGFDYRDAGGQSRHQDELVNTLHYFVSGSEGGIVIPPCAMYLDSLIGGQELWTGDTPRLGDEFIACVAIEGFPATSSPFLFDLLIDQPFPYRFSSRFIPLDAVTAEKELARYRRKWTQKRRGFWQQIFRIEGGYVNEDAALMASETEAALSEAASGRVAFGYYTAVIVLRGPDRISLAEQGRQLARQIRRLGFAARFETVNTLEAWLGSLPGHTRPNVRRPILHSLNYVHLVPASAVYTGAATNPSPLFPPHAPPLLHVATKGATPFRFNAHIGDVGHTLIFGPTGAGKSVILANLAGGWLGYRHAIITVFDKGWSMFALAKATGGDHYALGADDDAPGLCPLAFLDGQGDVVWAEEWLASCFELQTGKAPTPQQKGEIHKAIMLMRQAAQGRSLSDFLTSVQDREVREALRPYTLDGPLGELLDAPQDGLAASHFSVFELDELMERGPQVLIPVLLYLFRRFEQSLTGAPALLILDEAWIMLGHPVFREKLRAWLKTLRKLNCAVIIATQSLSDAWRSGLLDVLQESCPTRLFLPNAEAFQRGSGEVLGPYDLYKALGLNDTEIGIIAEAIPKLEFYYTSPAGRRLAQLRLGPIARAFTAVSAREEVSALKTLIASHPEGWQRQWLEQKGVGYAETDA